MSMHKMFVRGQPWTQAFIALDLANPTPQRLKRHAKLAQYRLDCRPLATVFLCVLEKHPRLPVPELPVSIVFACS